jgi:ABC-type multidrug transport system ATPase subunit
MEQISAGERVGAGGLPATRARLILVDDPDMGTAPQERRASQELLRGAAARGAAVLLATRLPLDAEGLADRIGLLRAGRLVLDDDAGTLAQRFRRLRYRNEVTSTRTEYGTELDLFDAVRVRVRGWGVEAIVANFTEELFERFRGTDGVVDAASSAMTLTEVFEAVAPEGMART